MSNLLPKSAEKRMMAEFRSRYLFAISLALLLVALLVILSLVPSAIGLVSFTPATQGVSQQSGDTKADSAAISHTKALMAALTPLSATSSLDVVAAALAERGSGVHIDTISYSMTQKTLSLAGHADSPGDVNAFQQALQGDPHFSNVSVPVSVLVGAQNGSFTITMSVQS